jgi:pyruvate carboxylase subunit B
MRYFVEIGSRTFQVDLGPDGTRIDGEPVEVDMAHVEGTDVRHLLVGGRSHRLVAERDSDGSWNLHMRGTRLRAVAVDERTRAIREMTGAGAGPAGPRPVKAPMPGLVVKVEVSVGDRIEPGQGVVIVEAMKMENELRAEGAAIVTAVHVEVGDTVDKGDILIDLGPLDEPEGAEAE